MPLGLSAKAMNIEPSATLAMTMKAKAMLEAGEKVINFAAGEPDFDTPVAIRDAMKDALDKGMTRYAPVGGTPELKKAIIEKLKRDNGLAYQASQIIVSNGAKHSLYNAFFALLNDGDEVIIPTPCWVSYPEIVRMNGGVPVFVPACEKDNFVPTPAAIAAAITPKTKAFILTSPNNPNGCVWPPEALEALANFAVKYDFYIISDEIYEHLIYGNQKHISIASLGEEIKERTIVVNGVSKTYAMTGFRIGFAAGPTEIVKAMTDAQSQSTSGANTPSMHAAAVALNMPQDCVETMRQAFQERRDALVKGLNAIPGITCRKPDGAFYVMMNVTALMGKRFGDCRLDDCEAFATMLLAEAKVSTVPGNAFMAEGFCRLSYATSMTDVLEGIRRIEAFVKALA